MIINEFSAFWGKSEKEYRHPAICHMLDVGLVAREILSTLPSSILQILAEELGTGIEDLSAYVAFFSSSHDIGKVSPGFQNKRPDLCKPLQDDGYVFSSQDETRHGVVCLETLPELLEEFGCDFDVACSFSAVLAAHHGVFVESVITECGSGKWSEARRATLAVLAGQFGITDLSGLKSPSVPALLFLAGLVSVADWIGSATEHFPYAEDPVPDMARYVEDRTRRAGETVRKLRFELAEQTERTFHELFSFDAPNPCQAATLEAVDALRHPMLIVVESPMGSGKTEAAQAAYARIAHRDRLRGMYCALPTQATGNAMLPRMEGFIGKLGLGGGAELHLLHANRDMNESYKRLRISAVEEEDGTDRGVTASSWFTARKRGLLAPFGVGTIDQALLSVLTVKHFFVRLFGLAGKMVVLDEVHAYDAYTTEIIFRLVGWLRHSQTSVVLLSATLPHALREKFLAAFGPGALPPSGVSYPCVTGVDAWGGAVARPIGGMAEDEIVLERVIVRADEKNGRIVAILKENLAQGGCAACIMNTVGEAQELYERVRAEFPDMDTILFHSRFTLEQKIKLEEAVLSRYGKNATNGNRPRMGIVVATQVLEQSLDVDFDLMVSDAAPVDLLLQRAGRLHRHERERPAPLKKRMLHVLMPDLAAGVPDFGGSGYVYERIILLKTCLLFDGARVRVLAPHGLSPLIESVYGREGGVKIPELLVKIAEKWAADCSGKESAETYCAKKCALKTAVACRDDPGYLGRLQNHFADNDGMKVAARLMRPSVTLVVLDGETVSEPNDAEAERRLYKRIVSTDRPEVVDYFLKMDPPKAWRTWPLIRDSRPLPASGVNAGRLRVTYDRELGLRITQPNGR